MTEVKDDTTILSETTESDRGIDITTFDGYQAPLDGTFDEFEVADHILKMEVTKLLMSAYLGYPWHVIAEIRQGFVAFNLPELMGDSLHVFIRIEDKERIGKRLILDLAGNLLERMGLPRGRVDLDAYRAARLRLHTFKFDDVAKKSGPC